MDTSFWTDVGIYEPKAPSFRVLIQGALRELIWFKKNISKGVQILEFITFYQKALHLTRVHENHKARLFQICYGLALFIQT